MTHNFINVNELYDDVFVPQNDRSNKSSSPQYTIKDEFMAVIQGMQAYVEIDLEKLGLTDDRM